MFSMHNIVIACLHIAGANVNDMGPGERSPLGEAAAKNYRKVAEVLVQSGANIEDPIPAYNNATPVVVAAYKGSHAVVDFLIRVCASQESNGHGWVRMLVGLLACRKCYGSWILTIASGMEF